MFDNVAAVVAGPDFVLEYPAQHPLAFGLFHQQCLYQQALGLSASENVDLQVFDLAFSDFPRSVLINGQTIPDKLEIRERLQNSLPLDKADFATAMELCQILKEYLGLLEDDNIIINNIINMSCQTYFNPGYTLLSL